MGCLQSSETKSEQENDNAETKPKVYSWEKRGNIDPNDYITEQLKDETVGKLPGKLNGQQYIIQNCEGCKIYIFDHTATVTVDDCVDCKIFLGPSKGSVYIRDCKDCSFVLACQQFRTRDCKRLDIFLCCNTQPIIESSTGMKFACFQYNYPELEDQFDAAGLSLYNNNWSSIHDFTPAADVETWSLLPENAKVSDYVPLPPVDSFPEIEVSADSDSSIVPLTLGSRRKKSDESCLVVFYPGPEARNNVKSYLREVKTKTSYQLVQTKEVQMTIEDAQRVFGSEHDGSSIQQGAVIGLEINGDGCVKTCNELLDTLLEGRNKSELVFISRSKEKSAKNIDDFYNFVDMTMS
ncbi:protein XRP2-like [Dendronephthya gigantea]|uniref:protein XRP2-like n=1 Tax=Dendronephthya gigantea TaxID=151771 RepID=UPI00106C6CD9|nr:protein XRP2-like [Dendronephthya gigantea]